MDVDENEGGYTSPSDEYDGYWRAFEDSSSGEEDCDRCGLCYGTTWSPKAVRCEGCKSEAYCSETHRDRHSEAHKPVCAPLAKFEEPAPAQDEDEPPIQAQEGSGLLSLPNEVLLLICHHLADSWALIALSHTCRALRRVARDPRAWQRVCYPQRNRLTDLYKLLGEIFGFGGQVSMRLMRLAPALRELRLDERWPSVNLTRCTKQVRQVEARFNHRKWDSSDLMGHFDSRKLYRLLRHYKGHVEVLKLTSLKTVCFSKALDRLGIKELYVRDKLVKAFPGSSKTVTSIKADFTFDGYALAELLKDCSHTLLSFRVWPADVKEIPWATNERGIFSCYDGPSVYVALKQCSLLQELRIPTWGNVGLLGCFPELRKLSLCDFGRLDHHGHARNFLRKTTALRRVERLTLRTGFYVHRGLLEPMARACLNVRFLRLIYQQATESRGFTVTVDLPRDLLAILGLMGDLETLEVYWARVPCTVFQGLAAGQLPNLTRFKMYACYVTPKARAAMEALASSRPDLVLEVQRLGTAQRNWDEALPRRDRSYYVSMPKQCDCDADSDDDEDDDEVSDSDSDADNGDPAADDNKDPVPGKRLADDVDFDIEDEEACQPLWSGRDPSDAELSAAEAEEKASESEEGGDEEEGPAEDEEEGSAEDDDGADEGETAGGAGEDSGRGDAGGCVAAGKEDADGDAAGYGADVEDMA